MNKNKRSKKEILTAMLNDENLLLTDEYREYLQNELNLLVKRAENKGQTKTQKENEPLLAEVLNLMTNEGQTVSELMAKSDVLKGLSNQKVTALVKNLVDNGSVERVAVNSKKTVFKLVAVEDGEESVEDTENADVEDVTE